MSKRSLDISSPSLHHVTYEKATGNYTDHWLWYVIFKVTNKPKVTVHLVFFLINWPLGKKLIKFCYWAGRITCILSESNLAQQNNQPQTSKPDVFAIWQMLKRWCWNTIYLPPINNDELWVYIPSRTSGHAVLWLANVLHVK